MFESEYAGSILIEIDRDDCSAPSFKWEVNYSFREVRSVLPFVHIKEPVLS